MKSSSPTRIQACSQSSRSVFHWLSLSSANGLPVAREALGYCYEKGQGISRDFDEAVTHYDHAMQNGAYLVAYRKAELLYKSHRGLASENTIRDLLETAANADIVPALSVVGFLAMQSEATRSLAIGCLGMSWWRTCKPFVPRHCSSG